MVRCQFCRAETRGSAGVCATCFLAWSDGFDDGLRAAHEAIAEKIKAMTPAAIRGKARAPRG